MSYISIRRLANGLAPQPTWTSPPKRSNLSASTNGARYIITFLANLQTYSSGNILKQQSHSTDPGSLGKPFQPTDSATQQHTDHWNHAWGRPGQTGEKLGRLAQPSPAPSQTATLNPGYGDWRRSSTWQVRPPPGVSSRLSSPPICAAASRAMARPRPVPPEDLLREPSIR